MLGRQLREEKECGQVTIDFLQNKIDSLVHEKKSLLEKINKQQNNLSELNYLKERSKSQAIVKTDYLKVKLDSAHLGIERQRLIEEVKDLKASLQARYLVTDNQKNQLAKFFQVIKEEQAQKAILQEEINVIKEANSFFSFQWMLNINSWLNSLVLILILRVMIKIIASLKGLFNLSRNSNL